VQIHERALVESALCFEAFRSERPVGLELAEGAAIYTGTMLDVGPRGLVRVGSCTMLHSSFVLCDQLVEIGACCLVSWNVLFMDTYRTRLGIASRRAALRDAAARPSRRIDGGAPARPVRIGDNVWIGFDACVLPGVSIGEGSIIGARSVVTEDIPAYTIAAGNPARRVRAIEPGERHHA
jgi:acetyltransferase-like isoleucine patch superfamily enzyme